MVNRRVAVEGMAGLAANFRAFDQAVQRRAQQATEDDGRALQGLFKEEAPKRTHFMADHTRLDFTPRGLGYSVGYDAMDFEAAGLDFYVPFVVYGTRFMAGNDFPYRAMERNRADSARRYGDALRHAAADASQ